MKQVAGAFLIAAICGAIASAQTETGTPQIDYFAPRGAMKGTAVEVAFRGRRLADPEEIVFLDPGVRAGDFKKRKDGTLGAVFTADAAAAPGQKYFYLRTASGMSEVMAFDVGVLAETTETEPNDLPGDATPIALETTANGVLANDDIDRYSFDAPENATITAEIAAVRLGGRPCDLSLELLDADGHLLAANEDSPLGRMDPILTHRFDRATKAVVLVRRQSATGTGSDPYRLSIGRFARPQILYPSGGAPGKTVRVEDAGGGETEDVRIPEDGRERFFYFPKNAFGPAPTPVSFYIDRVPAFTESAQGLLDPAGAVVPVDPAANVARVPVPSIVNGVIAAADQSDRRRFSAKKGAVIIVRALARAMRSPLDTVIEVRTAKGAFVGRNDDNQGPDSLLRVTAPEDGDLDLVIKDALGRGGPQFVYRLEIGAPPEAPELTVVPLRGFTATGVTIPSGGSAAAVFRLRNVARTTDYRLEISGLPDGVKAEIAEPRDQSPFIPVVFRAAPEAAAAASGRSENVRIRAVSLKDTAELPVEFAQILTLVEVENRRSYVEARIDRLPLSVIRPTADAIEVDLPKVPIVRGAPLSLTVHIRRRKDTKDALTLRLAHLPPGITASAVRVDGDQSEAVLLLNADDNAPEGESTFVVTASADGQGAIPVASAPAKIRVVPAIVSLQATRVRGEVGRTVEWPVKVLVNGGWTGTAMPEFASLPKGVIAEMPQLLPDAKELLVRLTIAPDALPGTTKNLVLKVRIPTADGEMLHQFRGGEIRIDPPLDPRPESAPPLDPAHRGTVSRPKT